ncbi:MAG TPA: hypothetical protein VHB47_21460 [Thermoanaerobaculia bacterium]|nr:hypothetical protein [Thermoanaerobaculia bacterium]
MTAVFGQDGRPRFVYDAHRKMEVLRSARGDRKVVTLHGDVRVVSYGIGQGYVERPLRPGYVQRDVVMGGRTSVGVYKIVSYQGIVFRRYVPAHYFHPRFYAWIMAPWPESVSYAWTWRTAPWYGASAAYFAPAAVYSDASLWLTDYVIASELEDAYYTRSMAGVTDPSSQTPAPWDGQQTALSPAVKAAIAEEVRQQIAADQKAATQPSGAPAAAEPPPAVDPMQRVFVVSSNIDAHTSGGSTCTLSAGDIILRTNDQISTGKTAAVTVLSSKAGDCPANSSTTIAVVALQEMYNEFQQRLGAGIEVLAQSQGKDGMPPGPPAGAYSSRDGQGRSDPSADAALINRQQQEADRAESEAVTASHGGR